MKVLLCKKVPCQVGWYLSSLQAPASSIKHSLPVLCISSNIVCHEDAKGS